MRIKVWVIPVGTTEDGCDADIEDFDGREDLVSEHIAGRISETFSTIFSANLNQHKSTVSEMIIPLTCRFFETMKMKIVSKQHNENKNAHVCIGIYFT